VISGPQATARTPA